MLPTHPRRAAAACAALAAAGALVLAGAPGSASAQADPAAVPSPAVSAAVGETSPEVLAAMRRDLGLTSAQAEARLVNEAEAGADAGALRNALGRDFAGAWVRGATSGTLTVATTDAADVPRIEASGARARWPALPRPRSTPEGPLDRAANRIGYCARSSPSRSTLPGGQQRDDRGRHRPSSSARTSRSAWCSSRPWCRW
ncbi:hypothetical protein SALBM135S_07102 [Streptomyces alboniger]